MRTTLSLLVLAVSMLSGCGGSGTDSDQPAQSGDTPQANHSDTEHPSTAAEAPHSANTSHEVSMEDIERWKRGMEAELNAVKEAATKLSSAKDENEKLEALHASTEMGTIEAGATAASVDPDRYRRIRNHFSGAVSQLSPIEMEMDVTQMPKGMVEQMQQARAAGAAQLEGQLPPDVLEALKVRAAELRQQEKLLVAERLKVATAAR